MTTKTLAEITSKDQYTEEMADNLMSLLSKGMRSSRRIYQVRLFCNYAYEPIQQARLKNWMLDRICFYPNGRCQYFAGQDYTAEIRAIVDILCK